MGEFRHDPSHWLYRLSPDEWIRAALGELARAEKAWDHGNVRAGASGTARAAGMALNGALIVEPRAAWGRTYLEHLEAVAADASLPDALRAACRRVIDARPLPGVVSLRTPKAQASVVDAARDVIAHAWSVVKRHEAVAG